MKLIQASAWYPPDSSGGVEVYVDGLAQTLKTSGFECTVSAPHSSKDDTPQASPSRTYQHNGIDVYRYSTFQAFADWLTANRGEIYHQHTIRDRCGMSHLRFARELGMKTVMTVHMPEVVCLRGTMMQGGQTACDGRIDVARCSQCLGVSKRVPNWLANSLSRVPSSLAAASRDRLRRSPDVRFRQLGTTLSTPAQVRAHDRQLRELVNLSDRIVVVCQWLYDAFIANGVSAKKLLLSRHGVSSLSPSARPVPQLPLKIGFMGRWQETKGVQVLIEALQRLPKSLPVELIIHATHADEHGQANREKMLAIAAQDSRIQIKSSLNREEVPSAIANFDLLAVPSQWLETGPLVVLEAHAVGTPVIGSNLGGIAELVRHGVDGWLIPAADIDAWAIAIQHLAENPHVVTELKQGIRPVKTTHEVAEEMIELYEHLVRHSLP
jgi:glycosyltransferase involved in cell wall biosynthesis